jgi:hypothetical protein
MAEHQPIMNPTPDSPDWAGLADAPADPSSLLALAGADPEAMTGPALVDAIVASEKALSFLAGKQMRLLTAFAKPFKAGDPMRLARQLARKSCITGDDDPDQVALYVEEAARSLTQAEVAAALRIPSRTAGHRVQEATTMTGVLAPTLRALETGELDRGKAKVIAEHCGPLSPGNTGKVQDLVLPGAGELTTSELREVTGQAVITVDPDGAQDRHQAAAARRELALQALPDAMASLKAYLPADGAVKIFQVSDLLATGTAGSPGDARGIGARRVDALVDIADQLLTHGFLDLTNYLGAELPDHGTPRARGGCADPDLTGNADPDTPGDAAAETENEETSDTNAQAEDQDQGAGDDTAEVDADQRDADLSKPEPGHDVTATASTDDPAPSDADDPEVDDVEVDDVEVDDVEVDDAEVDDAEVDTAPSDAAPGEDQPADDQPAATATGEVTKSGKASMAGNPSRVFTRQGRRPHLSVTLGLGTLAGLDNLPGTLAGFGAIPAGLARSIAASAATINALLTNPKTGTITAAGALTYRPTQDLRDQIAAILNVCQFPSCRQPTWRCDYDHLETFNHEHPERGGKTSLPNNGPFCRRHHLIKHHSAWKVRPDPDRTVLHFTSPTGHNYTKRGRQAAPPAMWVTTAGTTIAERLETITATAEVNRPPTPPSGVEDALSTILIRHALNTTPIEHQHDDTAWDRAAEQWNDPPPF